MITDRGGGTGPIEQSPHLELRNVKTLYVLYAFLIVTEIVMPQYFGVHIGYDITCLRFFSILIVGYMIYNSKLITHWLYTCARCKLFLPIMLYMAVTSYTMVLRVDINAFFLVFMEMLSLFLLIYGIRYVVGYEKAISWILGCAYFLGVYGLVEFMYGQSLFLKFLSTVPTTVNNAYRSGHYRVMGPCGHPLGYGLLLLLFLALACYDSKKQEVNVVKRPVLLVILLINIFLTGSRSTLGIVVLEIVLLLILSPTKNIKKTLLVFMGSLVLLIIFLLLFHNTGLGRYVLMQITSVIDHVFGTEYSADFGSEIVRLQDSENYRKFLPRIFTLDWLNPIVGRGVKRPFGAEIDGVYIQSIDNYYVQQYIKYAYPGLVTYVIFIISVVVMMVRQLIKTNSALVKVCLVGTIVYFYNLWWVDALQTLKFEYIIIAIFYAFVMQSKKEKQTVYEKE